MNNEEDGLDIYQQYKAENQKIENWLDGLTVLDRLTHGSADMADKVKINLLVQEGKHEEALAHLRSLQAE